MKAKELALTAIFIAIGAGLYSFTPQIGNITPDTVITFASLAILLVKPTIAASLGIGFVAGAWLGVGLAQMYARFFSFPYLVFTRDPQLYGLAALVTLAAATGGALYAVRSVVRLPPVAPECIRPCEPGRPRTRPPPKAQRRARTDRLDYSGLSSPISAPGRSGASCTPAHRGRPALMKPSTACWRSFSWRKGMVLPQ